MEAENRAVAFAEVGWVFSLLQIDGEVVFVSKLYKRRRLDIYFEAQGFRVDGGRFLHIFTENDELVNFSEDFPHDWIVV